ncbi:MAG: bifunctional 5,10-methylenetetrahydrofolate dehydrogenase/5,10-methenyltetrahydrofolate cyclohydrolase [Acidobacteriaceae bacterium]|nr:bifunctional 5,10-methylenetetrahydrofolate dehydrogenase/5,10-methenyltetrahydrofolate cyclohydrolase [Acidobacteriaceae bacterium]
MSGTVLDGKRIRDEILLELRPRIEALTRRKRAPALAVVLVGDNPASKIYVGSKIKACEEIGIRSVKITAPEDISTDELHRKLEPLRKDQSIDAILVQMPLPKQINAEEIVSSVVTPDRDVDGFGEVALGRLVLNRPWVRACTPAGIIEMLRRYHISMAGKKAVVVGRSDIVGKPMALMMLHENATVTVCHSRTQNLAEECRTADILVAAMGRTAALTADHIKPGAVVVDVGMNRVTDEAEVKRLFADDPARLAAFQKNGSVLVGDVEPKAMRELSSVYTPVPGGVGPLTIAMLMANTVTLAEHRIVE